LSRHDATALGIKNLDDRVIEFLRRWKFATWYLESTGWRPTSRIETVDGLLDLGGGIFTRRMDEDPDSPFIILMYALHPVPREPLLWVVEPGGLTRPNIDQIGLRVPVRKAIIEDLCGPGTAV